MNKSSEIVRCPNRGVYKNIHLCIFNDTGSPFLRPQIRGIVSWYGSCNIYIETNKM